MSRTTQLYIKVSNKYQEVDLFDDIVIPLTFKVTDIRNFGSKTSGYSLDFDIPHTNNNAILFGLNSEIDTYESTFEVGKDYPAYITTNSLTIFSGNFRLKKVIKKNRGTYIYYVGNLYGGAKTFAEELGNETLVGNDDASRDLDFSDYDTPSTDMQLNDFMGYLQTKYTDATGWGLTLIDKTNKAAQSFVGGTQEWYTDECTPYLYAREILDRIFSKTSYRYVSEFLQGTDFSTYLHDSRWANTIGKYDVNSIIYPYMKHNSNLHSLTPVSSEVVQLNGSNSTADIVYRDYDLFNDFVSLDVPTFQNSTLKFNTTSYSLVESNVSGNLLNYSFTAPIDGNYQININIPVSLRMNMAVRKSSPARIEPCTTGTVIKNRAMQYGHSPDDPNFSGTLSFVLTVEAKKNGVVSIGEGIDILQDLAESYTVENNNGQITLYSGTFQYQKDVPLRRGDTFSINTYISVPVYYKWWTDDVFNNWSWVRCCCYITESTYYNPEPTKIFLQATGNSSNNTIISILNDAGFYEGNDFKPTAILNPKTTKLDFFNYFVKAFNLYVEDVSGKVNYKTGGIYAPNTLRIEPYQIYYTPELGTGQTNLKDWTSKIDWDSVEYRRCDDYLYNIQNFTKAQDKDFYTENYNNTFITPYGNRKVKGIYCTSSDTNNIDLKVSSNMCGLVNNQTDTLQCPKVFSLDKSGNIDTKKEYNDGLFFLWKNEMDVNTTLHQNYFLTIRSRTTSMSTFSTWYYCADTLNKGYGLDDANLNWGGTEAYYQNMKGTIPTYNDLYSAFYKLQYEEYTANDCRILKGNAYLSVMDIYNIQLSDLIMVNGNTYHILSIDQWKNEKTPCTVELIKCKPNFKGTEPNNKIVFPIIDNINVMPIATETAVLQEQIKDLADEVAKYQAQTAQLQKDLESVQALQVAQNLELEVQP